MNPQTCIKCKKTDLKEQIKGLKEIKTMMKKDFQFLSKFVETQKKKYKGIDKHIEELKARVSRLNAISGSDKNKMLSELSV